jgi:hypothetical protein
LNIYIHLRGDMKQEKLCESEDMLSGWPEELGVENGRLRQQLRELDAMQTFPEKPKIKVANSVDHPNHYTSGGIEVIDYIRAKLTPAQLKGYYVGNLLKYLSRADHKGGVEDYKKAQVYLRWLIELEEKQETHTED